MATIQQKRAIREVINNNFTFSDLSSKFKNIDGSSGNIYCPFHENHDTPAAKMYWDENREIWIIHCFGECHKNFTTYDYVNLILCEKYQKYKSPLAFLQANMDSNKLNLQLKICEKTITENSKEYFKEKINYINSVYNDYNNITDYIEKLYTE